MVLKQTLLQLFSPVPSYGKVKDEGGVKLFISLNSFTTETTVTSRENSVIPFSTNVPLTDKSGSCFLLAKCLKSTCGRVTFEVKMQIIDVHLYL